MAGLIGNMVGSMIADNLEQMKIEEDIEQVLEPQMHDVTKDFLDTLCLYFTNDSIKACKAEKTSGNISDSEFEQLFKPGCPDYINGKAGEFIKSYLEYIDGNLLNNKKIADYMISYGKPDKLFFLKDNDDEDIDGEDTKSSDQEAFIKTLQSQPDGNDILINLQKMMDNRPGPTINDTTELASLKSIFGNAEEEAKIKELETMIKELESNPSGNDEVSELQKKLKENTIEIDNLKKQVEELDDLRNQLSSRDDEIRKLKEQLSKQNGGDETKPKTDMIGGTNSTVPMKLKDGMRRLYSLEPGGTIPTVPTDSTSALPGDIANLPTSINIKSNKAADVLDYFTESVNLKLKCDDRIHKYIQKKIIDVIFFTAVRMLTPHKLELLKPYAKTTTEKHIDECMSIIKTNLDKYSSLLKDNMENKAILTAYLQCMFELYVYYEYCQNSKMTISITKDDIVEHIKTANIVEMIHKDSTNTNEINPYLKSFDEASVQKQFDMDKHNKKTASNFVDLFKKVKPDNATTSGGSKRRKKDLKNKHTLPAYRKCNRTRNKRHK
jgi:prefoldin subunit 5